MGLRDNGVQNFGRNGALRGREIPKRSNFSLGKEFLTFSIKNPGVEI